MIVLGKYSEVAFDLDSESTDSESDNETGHARYGMNIAKRQRFSYGAQQVDCFTFFVVVYYGSTGSVSFLLICRAEYRCWLLCKNTQCGRCSIQKKCASNWSCKLQLRTLANCELFLDFLITQYFTIQLLLLYQCHTHEVSKPIQELKVRMVHNAEYKLLSHNFTAVWNRYACETAGSLIRRWHWRPGFNRWCNATWANCDLGWWAFLMWSDGMWQSHTHPPLENKKYKEKTHTWLNIDNMCICDC